MRAEPARWLAARPVLVTALVLTVLLHLPLLLGGTWRSTYDAYVHLFFADHYQRSWFSTWETRWYTGFPVTSYPPGAHMALAAVTALVPVAVGYPLVQTSVLLLVTIGTYRSARIWVDDTPAQWAAVMVALSPALGEVVHVFGQVPTTFGLAFTLNALPFAHRWVRVGRARNLVLALVLAAAATSAHHVTTLFGSVFFVGPVLLRGVVDELRVPHPDEPQGHRRQLSREVLPGVLARRLRRIHRPLARAMTLGVALGLVLATVVLPYWLYSAADPIVQIPIPHASREDYLADLNAGLVFWLIPWGPLVLALPWAVWRGLRSRAWPLMLSVLLLTVLGLGGTTPIARALLGGAFDILTFDRFTIWATVAVLPVVGLLVAELVAARRWAVVGTAGVAVLGALVVAVTLTTFRPFQPDPIDPDPIVEFLAKDDHDDWRYLALGFGDQMALLSARTTATTVDGNYHSARRLPQLTTRAVERLEGAKFRGVPGLGSLQQFLVAPEPVNLKYVVSADAFYDPLLHFTGWQDLGALENGVRVWERPDVPPLPEVLPRRELPAWQRLHWGVVPPGALLLALVLLPVGVRWPATTQRPPGVSAPVDRWLGRRAGTAGGEDDDAGWLPRLPDLPGLPLVGRLARLASAAGDLGRRVRGRPVVAAVLLVVAGLALAAPVVRDARAPAGPGATAVAYLQALDERRAEDARNLIDPAVRPSADAYRLIRSVDGGGLSASYARLDDVVVRTAAVSDDGTTATVVVDVTSLTPLSADERTRTLDLRRADGRWFVVPPPRDLDAAAEQLTVLPGVSYLQVGRRSVTTTRTTDADVLDRPALEVASARLLHDGERHVVVGEVRNVDADPAALTVTGQLQGADGEVLVEWNAGQASAHTLRPGETAPFRIDFEGVAGAAAAAALVAPDFQPEGFTPPTLPADAEVTGADVYARAVVTTRGLARLLAPTDVTAQGRDGRLVVSGRLHNVGAVEAAVPQVLLAALDADGAVVWTDMAYLPEGIRPQLSAPFEVTLPDLAGLRTLGTARTFANGLPASDARSHLADIAVPVSGVPGVAAVAVVARAWAR